MTPFLEARNVTKTFSKSGLFHTGETVALEQLTISIKEKPASIIGVAGESGSGKTTLAGLMMGVTHPTQGEVLYRGKELRCLKRKERLAFRKEVQAVFQDPYGVYNPFYKIDHALYTPLKKLQITKSKAKAQSMIEEAMTAIGLNPGEILGRYPQQLSGGQRQRIMVARAFLINPRLILADEPVSMVDASLRATILQSLQKLNTELGISILYISHDLTTTYQISDHIIVLYYGTVAEIGDSDQVIGNPGHPYTQLLVESNPQLDPDMKWSTDLDSYTSYESGRVDRGCKFAPSCPRVIPDLCREAYPPLYQIHNKRAVRCFLYKGAPEISSNDMSRIIG